MAGKKRSRKGAKRASPERAEVQLPDARAMERTMAELRGLLQDQQFESEEEAQAFVNRVGLSGDLPRRQPATALEAAQQVMYDAWEAAGADRVKLARRALEISADCADAYVLIAEEEAGSAEEARALYQQGVAAGERGLGAEPFEELAGSFWGFLETRPYMRARAGLAICLWEMQERDPAIEHLQDMLRLNPGDNQGLRRHLVMWLLAEGRQAEARALLDQYPEDGSLEFAWAEAIHAFQSGGASEPARHSFREAVAGNPHLISYLLGLERMPEELPAHISPGEWSEAAHCVVNLLPVLRSDPDLPDWLVGEVQAIVPEPRGPAPGRG